jgi:antibiotic biosynthesis monooxygenase (ABM) superfamily enzyme
MSKHQKLQPWQQRVLGTLLGWIAAFAVVSAMQLAIGEWLQTLPEVVHILILTGVLVTIMGNVMMPAINKLIARRSA